MELQTTNGTNLVPFNNGSDHIGISGLTDSKSESQTISYSGFAGKITTGYRPGDPGVSRIMAAKCFVIRKFKVARTGKSGKEVDGDWAINKEAMDYFSVIGGSTKPRKIPIYFLHGTVPEVWVSETRMYEQRSKCVCKSKGAGFPAYNKVPDKYGKMGFAKKLDCKNIDFPDELFDTCQMQKCPYFIDKKCTPYGMLLCWTMYKDSSGNEVHSALPYYMETRSINTIARISESFKHIQKISNVARGEEGFKLFDFNLIHRHIVSGGRDVYITELHTGEVFDKVISKIIEIVNKSYLKTLLDVGMYLTFEEYAEQLRVTGQGKIGETLAIKKENMIEEGAVYLIDEDEVEAQVEKEFGITSAITSELVFGDEAEFEEIGEYEEGEPVELKVQDTESSDKIADTLDLI